MSFDRVETMYALPKGHNTGEPNIGGDLPAGRIIII